MNGNFIDSVRCRFKNRYTSLPPNYSFVKTDFGIVRVYDSKGDGPVILSVPDGPNVIEHHQNLISELAKNFRVICFEFIGLGKSYPNRKYDYSFIKASGLTINLMDILNIEKAALAFSCSNGFYAIKTAELNPERITHLFLSQTPSISAMVEWTEGNIPPILRYPILGQIVNALSEKKLSKIWYKYALPKSTNRDPYVGPAISSLKSGGCFCLSALVQGLQKESLAILKVLDVPSTIFWGTKDYTHRNTPTNSILEHLPNADIFEFENSGHFPELEETDKYVAILKEKLHF